jgi:hypothetical protein
MMRVPLIWIVPDPKIGLPLRAATKKAVDIACEM